MSNIGCDPNETSYKLNRLVTFVISIKWGLYKVTVKPSHLTIIRTPLGCIPDPDLHTGTRLSGVVWKSRMRACGAEPEDARNDIHSSISTWQYGKERGSNLVNNC